jgi:hypothetical protein
MYRNLPPSPRDWGVSNLIQYNLAMSPAKLGSDKDCADEAQQQLPTTDPDSRPRGCPHQYTCNCLTATEMWSLALEGRSTPRQTGQLAVGLNTTLTFDFAQAMNLFDNSETTRHQTVFRPDCTIPTWVWQSPASRGVSRPRAEAVSSGN